MKKIIILFVILQLLGLAACETKRQPLLHRFKFPPIINAEEAIDYFQSRLTEAYTPYLGVYNFDDTVNLDLEVLQNYQSANRSRENALLALLNTPNNVWQPDSLALLDLKVLVDEKVDLGELIPVYLVNKSTKIKAVHITNDYLYMTQEAENEQLEWQPIERTGLAFCAMGFYWQKLYPNEFMLFLAARYKGDFKTRLRIKFTNGKQIYYSAPFSGSVDKKQFVAAQKNRIDY